MRDNCLPLRLPVVRTAAACLAAAALAACGGGGGSTTAPPTETPPPGLSASQAWSGPLPANARTIDRGALDAALAAGDFQVLTPMTDAQRAADVAAERSRIESGPLREDIALLATLPEPSLELQRLLALAQPAAAAGGKQAQGQRQAQALVGAPLFAERPARNTSDAPLLLSAASALSAAAAGVRELQDVARQRQRYADNYALLTPEQRSETLAPAALDTASMAEVQAALRRQQQAIAQIPALDGSYLLPEPDATATGRKAAAGLAQPLAAPVPGNADDSPTCPHLATSVWANFYWPLRDFVTPVRSQGRRGTCWAFAAVAAMEVRERVVRQQTRNLSEQFLVAKVKADWTPSPYVEGGSAEDALAQLRTRRQTMPAEADWTYNGSYARTSIDPVAASFVGACNGYGGSCSETASQAPIDCTPGPIVFCGTRVMTYAGIGPVADPTTTLWSGSAPLPLDELRMRLARGEPLLFSFGTRKGFDEPEGGFVVDTSDTFVDDDGLDRPGARGNHAVLIVGYIDAASIANAANAGRLQLPRGVPDGVRGYFILKNSWGCHGDGGLVYMPDNAVQRWGLRISSLDIGSERSTQWQERNLIRPTAQAALPLRVVSDVFIAAPPPGKSLNDLRVQVSSSVAGDSFTMTPFFGVLYGRSAFATAGTRTVTVSASTDGVEGVQTLSFPVTVANQPPQVQVVAGTGVNPVVGNTYTLAVRVTDPNEDASALCSRVQWLVTAPDVALDGGTGCTQRIVYGTTGARTVRISAVDSDGGVGTIEYLQYPIAPPANPYPRITGARLRAPDVNRGLQGCLPGAAQADGALVDMRSLPGTLGCNGLPQTAPFYAWVDVENPTQERLTVRWSLWAGDIGSTVQVFSTDSTAAWPVAPAPYGDGQPVACGVTVSVKATDDPARQASTTVWYGSCLLPPVVPR